MEKGIGTCAICLREGLATQDGTVSLHGFQRRGGGGMRSSIQGRCFGSYRVALEIGTSACAEYIAHIERSLPETLEWVRRVESGETQELVSATGRKIRPGDVGWERAHEKELRAAKDHLARLESSKRTMEARIAKRSAA